MNPDQLEALLHILLGGVAAYLVGQGSLDQSTATQIIGGITGAVAAFLSYRTNTAAAVAASATANAQKKAPAIPPIPMILFLCVLGVLAVNASGCATMGTPEAQNDLQAGTQFAVTTAINHNTLPRADFVLAKTALDSLIGAKVTDPAAILAGINLVIPAKDQASVDQVLQPFLTDVAADLPAVDAGLIAALTATAPPTNNVPPLIVPATSQTLASPPPAN